MSADLTREIEMILHPMRWPNLVLPLKNPSKRFSDESSQAVFSVPLSKEEISPSEPLEIIIGANLFLPSAWKDCERKTYSNVQALLDDGWRVD